MSDITNRIDRMLILRKQKRAEMARATGITEGTFRAWIRGSAPSAEYLCKVAQFLGCSLDWLITGIETDGISLSNNERELIELYKTLNDSDKNAVFTLAKSLAAQYSVILEKNSDIG